MNGMQFVRALRGELEPDQGKIDAAIDEANTRFPKGALNVNRERFTVSVHCRMLGDTPLCMSCGQPLVNRVNQFYRDGQWHNKKRRDYLSNWECPRCSPGTGSPLAACWSIGRD